MTAEYLDAVNANSQVIGQEKRQIVHQILTIDRHEIAQIAYPTISELEEMMARGQVPCTSWFVQLLHWYTGKRAEMQVIWARR